MSLNMQEFNNQENIIDINEMEELYKELEKDICLMEMTKFNRYNEQFYTTISINIYLASVRGEDDDLINITRN